MATQYEPGTFYFADGTVDPYPYANIPHKPPSYKGGPPQFSGRMQQRPMDALKDVLGLFGLGGGKGNRTQPQPLNNGGAGAAMNNVLYNQPSWLITQ